jgi:hypothetical protein
MTCALANPAIIGGGITGGALIGGGVTYYTHKGTAELKKNMNAAGNYLKPKYWSHHHIVAQDDPGALVSRIILGDAGMSVNDAFNGILMHSMYHDQIHTPAYHAAVLSQLGGATAYGDVAQRLTLIRLQINLGVFPW